MADTNFFRLKSIVVNAYAIIKKRGLEPSGEVQKVIDSEVLRLCDQYVPLDTGALRDSGQINTRLGSGEVIYSTPYARKQYYIPMPHDGGRTDYWFEHMKNEGGKEKILDATKKASGAK